MTTTAVQRSPLAQLSDAEVEQLGRLLATALADVWRRRQTVLPPAPPAPAREAA